MLLNERKVKLFISCWGSSLG